MNQSVNHPLSRFRPLRVPVFAAPMFLVSSPALIVAACRAGIGATFPAPNCRTTAELGDWLTTIAADLAMPDGTAPYCWGVNLIVHDTNPRLHADLEMVAAHRVPFVAASVGSPKSVVEPVHRYGGLVFADVLSLRHARLAIDAGVDGLILLTSGAGGHEGSANPFAYVREVRRIWDGPLVLAGCISDGASILAARALGADYVSVGTAFIAATESLASQAYREMLITSTMDDIVCSAALSGMNANLLRASFSAAGFDADKYARKKGDVNVDELHADLQKQRWKDIWAAGQAVGGVNEITTAQCIVDRLVREYSEARAGLNQHAHRHCETPFEQPTP